MIKSFLSNNTSNRFKFIMTPTRRNNLWPLSQKGSDDSTFKKDPFPCSLCQVSLKSGQFTGDSKGATSAVNIYYL